MSESERIQASEWILQAPENYLHIQEEPIEGEEALKLIQGLLDAGAVKVEVTKKPGHSDDPDDDEREQLYIDLPTGIPKNLLLEILELRPDEFFYLKDDPFVLRLWWDNH